MMWITGYVTGNSFPTRRPSVGEVRSAGEKVSVRAGAEYRSLPVVVPYGIAYVPPIGESSVIMPTEDGSLCMGVIEGDVEGLEQGELMLYSAGGASIVLKNDGSVLINGRAV